MFGTGRVKSLAALVATALAFSVAQGSAGAATFSAGLVRCSTVTQPAVLSSCGTDPLKAGSVTINDLGDATINLEAAFPDTQYSASFVSIDGTKSTLIGNLPMTGPKGNSTLRKEGFFKFGRVGAGNVVLSSGALVEFVSGLAVSSTGFQTGHDFEPGLVRCAEVTVPASLSICGHDPLAGGHVFIENSSGDLTIRISGAAASTSYSAILLAANGTSSALGPLSKTDKHGNGAFLLKNPAFAAGTVLSGTVVVQNGGTDEFLSGFKVNVHPTPPPVSQADLVRCSEVTDPVFGANCGGDQLDGGFYMVDAVGRITVVLRGAVPSTNYEVFFRPLDNSGDVDTGLLVPTGPDGNANPAPFKFFVAGTVASGTLVVKEHGTSQPDQFVAGYTVR